MAQLQDAVKRVSYAAQRAQEQLEATEEDLYLGLGAWQAVERTATAKNGAPAAAERTTACSDGHTLPCFLRALLRELQALVQQGGACSDDEEPCMSVVLLES